MKNNLKETIVTAVLVILAVLILNPFDFWMPDMMLISLLACALVLFGIFASFIMREKAFDEREVAHRTLAGRNAFLAGSAVLMMGIVIQAYTHVLDPWLVIALIGMVAMKTVTRIWSDHNR